MTNNRGDNMKKDSGKKEPSKKASGKTEDSKKTVSGLVSDAKKDAVYVGQKSTAAAKDTGSKFEKAGNEMKASLQEMKKDIQQIPKKADKKSRK
jgi:F0F1-type ATP synthase membrane subunit b/b'